MTGITRMLAAFTSLLLAIRSAAAETIRPDIGQPLRDASVCAAPDGNYYLTGVIATALPNEKTASYDNCRGVQVWKSKDLKSWEDLGLVWDLWKDPQSRGYPGKEGSFYQTELYPVPGLPSGERARGMTAPRLAHDGSRFWITYSMNGYAAGAMPGGADVKAPYKDTRLLVEMGGSPTGQSDASLFVDTDGIRYLVWGGGCIAKLKSPEALAQLKADGKVSESGVDEPVHYLPATMDGFTANDGLPERGAPYGGFVFQDGQRYRFIFAATTLRDGGIHEDSYICRADKLLGPYSKPEFLVLDSGRCSAFKGPDGQWRLAYSDVENRPVITGFTAATTVKAGAPAPARGKIATAVPPRPVSVKPKDVPQLIEYIEPCLDQPLRDAAICRGPDGTWCMTGTEATWNADGTLDWSRNNGVHLWSSTDRQNWRDSGYVWEISAQEPGHLDLTCGATPRIGRAVTAPEIHYLKGTFWIAYSMNGSAIGLLKSTTGKAEGPYVDVGIKLRGRDPSLFEDGGTVYLVWGEGFNAKLNDELTGLASPVKTLFPQVHSMARCLRGIELMGSWGSHMVKQGEWYVWTFTARTGRAGVNAIDTVATWSKSLDGPWGQPCLMLSHGGQSTLVSDGTEGWLATVSGEDEYSQCPFQACITPVASQGALGKPLKFTKANLADPGFFQAVNAYQETSLDLWIGWPDLLGTAARDVAVIWDGKSYLMAGTHWGTDRVRNTKTSIWHSPDLSHWAEWPGVYDWAQLQADGMVRPELISLYEERIKTQKVRLAEPKIFQADGKYHIIIDDTGSGCDHTIVQSQGADPKGPYKAIASMVYGCITGDKDCSFYVCTPTPAFRRFDSLNDYLSSPHTIKDHMANALPFAVRDLPNICISEDCEVGLERVRDKWVWWSVDWTGSYEDCYLVADTPTGPWKGKLRVWPDGSNGKFFEDKDGNYWHAYARNLNSFSATAQTWDHLNMYPLDAYENNGELIIEPKAMRANRARIEQMGTLWHGKQ